MSDFFLDGLHEDRHKRDIMTSPLWPFAVAAVNLVNNANNGNKIVIGDVSRFTNNAIRSIDLVTPDGFRVACIARGGTTDSLYHFGRYSSPVRAKPDIDACFESVKSKNMKYVIRKLNTPNSDPHNALFQGHYNASTFVNSIIHKLLARLLSMGRGGWREDSVDIRDDIALSLVRLFVGDLKQHDISGSDSSMIQSYFEKYKQILEKRRQATENSRNFWDNDKWVIVPNVNDGSVILGGISRQPLVTAFKYIDKDGHAPEPTRFSYLDAVVPFKWYRSYSDVPEDIRKDIDIKLTMLKVSRNWTFDGNPLFHGDVDATVAVELGAFVYSNQSASHESSVFIVDKSA